MSRFAQLVKLLADNNVNNLELFKQVVREAEQQMETDGAWRSAKSVLKKAIIAGIEYRGLGKSRIEILTKTIKD